MGEHVAGALFDEKLEIMLHVSYLIAAHAVPDHKTVVQQDNALVELVDQSPLVGNDDDGLAELVYLYKEKIDLT